MKSATITNSQSGGNDVLRIEFEQEDDGRWVAEISALSGVIDLLAYAGRDTGTREVVYKHPDNFRRELELYNLHRVLASERYEDDGLVIVPDFFDVIALFEAGITNAVALMEPEASDHQLGKLRELDNPSGLFTVVVAHPDQAAGEELACKLASIGYAHLTITSIDNALSEMSIEQFGRLFS